MGPPVPAASAGHLRVARIAERLPPFPGGKEIHVAELSLRQAQRGHAVHLWCRSGSGALPGVELHRVGVGDPTKRYGVLTVADFSLRAARQLGSVQPDVVHLHGDWVEAWSVRRAARRLGIPVVLTVHGGLAPAWSRPSRHAFRHVDAFIAVAANVKDDLTSLGVDPGRITVISSGLNRELLAPHLGAPRAQHRIVSVGALEHRKGHDVLLAAFARIRQQLPDAELVIIGGGSQEAQLRGQAERIGGVRFSGQLDRASVYAEVAGSSAFVLASRPTRGTDEGTPTALLEAMALGVPVVATRAGGTASLLASGQAGMLVEVDDVPAMTDCVLQLLTNDGLSDRLSRAGAEAVAGRDWDTAVERIDAVYASVGARVGTSR